MFYDLAKLYPEVKQYKMTNKLNDDEFLVTDEIISEKFSEYDRKRLYSGRHPVFFLEEIG